MTTSSRINSRLTPTWIDLTCTLAGARSALRRDDFRYLHLGCGAGFTTTLIAALHPAADVRGYDPDPASIATARELAAMAGITNVSFECRSVQTWGGLDLGGEVHILVVDEVLCSTDEHGRRAVVDVVDRWLAPGAPLCVSYRALAGWAEAAALQRAVRVLASRWGGSSIDRSRQFLEILDRLAAGGASFLERPYIQGLLDDWISDDVEAVACEVLGRDLDPISLAGVVELLGSGELGFVGSAQLLDDTGLVLTDAVRDVVDGVPDRVRREVLRDLVTHQTLRTDVFLLGERRLSDAERAERVAQTMLVAGSCRARRTSVETTSGAVAIPATVFAAVRETLEAGPSTVATVLDRVSSNDHPVALDGSLLLRTLIESGEAMPVLTHSSASASASASIARLADSISELGHGTSQADVVKQMVRTCGGE